MIARVYYALIFSCALCSCEELERVLLLRTELESQINADIIVRGVVADLPPGLQIATYGHCWSDQPDPTVDGPLTITTFSESVVQDHSFSYTSTLTEILSKKTYYVRSYVSLENGEVRYGNILSITSGPGRGRWTKLADHWHPSELTPVEDDGSGCGPSVGDVTAHSLFPAIGFYQDRVVAFGGFTVYAFGRTYDSECEDPAAYLEDGWGVSQNQLMRIHDGQEWGVNGILGDILAVDGGIAVVNDGLLYFGAGAKDRGYPLDGFFNLYQYGASYGGFYAADIQNGITLTLSDIPTPKIFATSFFINSKIYVVGGICGNIYEGENYVLCPDEYVFDIASGEWQSFANFPGGGLVHGVSFVLNGKAYVGSGFANINHEVIFLSDESEAVDFILPDSPTNDFWEYTPETDTWKKVSALPAAARGGAFGFGLQGYGYLGCGTPGLFKKYLHDFWRYDPVSDNWTQLDDYPGGRRFGSAGFANDTHGAAGFGYVIKDDEPDELPVKYLWYDEFGTEYQSFNHFRGRIDSDLWIYDPSLN